MKPAINVFATDPILEAKAQTLAKTLALPYGSENTDYSLQLSPQHLSLQDNRTKGLALTIDFLSGPMTYRRQRTSLKRETLARALGLKNNTQPNILDATAGLGRDSFILACLGFEVTLLERSPIIQALLKDGMERALSDPAVTPIIQRMHLIATDAVSWLTTLKPEAYPDIIYLDPMFPERTKSALVKKEMRIFHALVGEDPDADQLFKLALTCALKRVVVKRPRLAAPLADLKPSFSQIGSSCRFDIYLT